MMLMTLWTFGPTNFCLFIVKSLLDETHAESENEQAAEDALEQFFKNVISFLLILILHIYLLPHK